MLSRNQIIGRLVQRLESYKVPDSNIVSFLPANSWRRKAGRWHATFAWLISTKVVLVMCYAGIIAVFARAIIQTIGPALFLGLSIAAIPFLIKLWVRAGSGPERDAFLVIPTKTRGPWDR